MSCIHDGCCIPPPSECACRATGNRTHDLKLRSAAPLPPSRRCGSRGDNTSLNIYSRLLLQRVELHESASLFWNKHFTTSRDSKRKRIRWPCDVSHRLGRRAGKRTTAERERTALGAHGAKLASRVQRSRQPGVAKPLRVLGSAVLRASDQPDVDREPSSPHVSALKAPSAVVANRGHPVHAPDAVHVGRPLMLRRSPHGPAAAAGNRERRDVFKKRLSAHRGEGHPARMWMV